MKQGLSSIAAIALLVASAHAQPPASLGGVWTYNKAVSEAPAEIGFNVAWLPSQSAGGQESAPATGGRGRRGGGGGGGSRAGGGAFSAPRESYEDSQRIQIL